MEFKFYLGLLKMPKLKTAVSWYNLADPHPPDWYDGIIMTYENFEVTWDR